MDVFLIPTATDEPYELYYEAPDEDLLQDATEEDGEEAGDERSWHPVRFVRRTITRMRLRFAAMLKEAEDWRHRRHEEEPPSTGLLSRAKRHVMGFVVERIAEQRLLWHLRRATHVCAQIPSDLPVAEADRIIRQTLKANVDHHFKWLLIDAGLLLLSAPLMVIPGPNVPGFYFTFQVISHYLSWTGAKQGLSTVQWDIHPNAALTELRSLLEAGAPQRSRRIHELAARLRLQHLATFFEQVAAPTA